ERTETRRKNVLCIGEGKNSAWFQRSRGALKAHRRIEPVPRGDGENKIKLRQRLPVLKAGTTHLNTRKPGEMLLSDTYQFRAHFQRQDPRTAAGDRQRRLSTPTANFKHMRGPFIDMRLCKQCVKEPFGRLSSALIVEIRDFVESPRTLQALFVREPHFY